MREIGIIKGSRVQAVPFIVGVDTVYVHTEITPIIDQDGMFQYKEIQYNKDEYIQLMAETNMSLELQLTDTQLALIEIYESMV